MGNDPSPLATSPTKWRAEHCVTHHHACDCREWVHAEQIAALESRLAAANALLREIVGFPWFVTRAPFTTEEIQAHLQGAGDEA